MLGKRRGSSNSLDLVLECIEDLRGEEPSTKSTLICRPLVPEPYSQAEVSNPSPSAVSTMRPQVVSSMGMPSASR